jgi:hypothetical protein
MQVSRDSYWQFTQGISNHRKEVGMLFRPRNHGSAVWSALLAVAWMLSVTTVTAAVQDAEAVGQAEKPIQEIMEKALDPEGLSGTPEALMPTRRSTESSATELVATPDSEVAEGSQEPRVALRPAEPRQDIWLDAPASEIVLDGSNRPLQSTGGTAATTIPSQEATYQTPRLRMTTLGPGQANIHRTSQYRFRIINDGPAVAEGVNLAIEIEGSGRVVSTYPEGAVQQTEAVYFRVGDLGVGEIKEYGFEFQADRAGQIQVTPRLTSSSTTRFISRVTAPRVRIDIQGEDTFVVGQAIRQQVVIHNEGTETVRNIVVRQACTPSNAFEKAEIGAGQQMVDAIIPGQSRTVEVTAVAVQQGPASLQIVVEGDNVRGTSSRSLTFLQSQLTTSIQGPELIYLNSLGTYGIDVTNDQIRDLENIQVKLSLPIGMIVKVIDRKAEFDAASSSITWTIPKLSAGATEHIPFKATLSQFGQHVVKATVSNSAGAMTHTQMTTQAVGRADIDVKVVTNPEPIETGSTTSIIVQVQNRGTQPANDVSVLVSLPESFDGIESADYAINDGQVRFDSFRLEAGQIHNLTIPIRCDTAGDHIVRATVESSASTKAIAAENSLFFFSTSSMRNAGFRSDR